MKIEWAKRIVALCLFILLLYSIKRTWHYYNNYYYAESFWKVPVPYGAKQVKYEREYDFGGWGHSTIVFDVSDVEGKVLEILETKKFNKSLNNELVYTYYYRNVSLQKIISDKTMKEDLGLKNGYYYDKDFNRKSFKIVIYNPTIKKLYFFHRFPI